MPRTGIMPCIPTHYSNCSGENRPEEFSHEQRLYAGSSIFERVARKRDPGADTGTGILRLFPADSPCREPRRFAPAKGFVGLAGSRISNKVSFHMSGTLTGPKKDRLGSCATRGTHSNRIFMLLRIQSGRSMVFWTRFRPGPGHPGSTTNTASSTRCGALPIAAERDAPPKRNGRQETDHSGRGIRVRNGAGLPKRDRWATGKPSIADDILHMSSPDSRFCPRTGSFRICLASIPGLFWMRAAAFLIPEGDLTIEVFVDGKSSSLLSLR